MNKEKIICPKCHGNDVQLNNQVSAVQNLESKKDLKFEKYHKYLCKDCGYEFS